MNNDIAIKVENLTKIYHLYDKPQDRLKEALNPFNKSYHHDFYAMQNVSFEIRRGETVGILGRNGAGKSTLLKMITGVLTPTSGSMEVQGKIASLLELGAGFNPEMTGMENIYLNGTLMGFTKEEMDAKINDIIVFADIGEFIYQPAKMYSSGMYARLAFAVSINVEPEILIVDEALSVGDIKFQIKCINKFKELQEKGITILFVSHDLFTVRSFCNKAIWLHDGQVKETGDVTEVTAHYNEFMYGTADETSGTSKKDDTYSEVLTKDFDAINRWGDMEGIIEYVEVLNDNDKPENIFTLNQTITIKMVVNTEQVATDNLSFAISVKDKNGVDLIVSTTMDQSHKLNTQADRIGVFFKFENYLATGEYIVVAAVEDRTMGTPHYYDYIEGACYFKSEVADMRFGLFHQPVTQLIKYKG
ncbi:ABC transporter ATP-binding protein [Sulfurovum sp.]|uniref:ABC transporter ATP-binding protein n=1 Tax=Sulfurovum sp. TaxID=1969726 RepID=UPI0025D12977|nr:ABC transporter ATP-binding protein [Sulfurovum sp.]